MNAHIDFNKANELDLLAHYWQRAKADEAAAKEKRLAIEEKITALVGVKDEGVSSLNTEAYKIKTTGKLTRTLDTDAIYEVWDKLPEPVQDCIKWKAELNTTAYRALSTMRDDLLPILNQYMTTKSAKAAISVEEI